MLRNVIKKNVLWNTTYQFIDIFSVLRLVFLLSDLFFCFMIFVIYSIKCFRGHKLFCLASRPLPSQVGMVFFLAPINNKKDDFRKKTSNWCNFR